MAHLKKIHVIWLLLALLVMFPSRTAGAMSPPSLACGGWTIVSSPNPASYFNRLNSVAAVSPKDVWAVGYDYANGGPIQPLIQHWDGSRWQAVASPTLGSSVLAAVTALSASDVWAVGYRGLGTLIEHWDGVQWKIVPSPNRGSYLNGLSSLSALSPSDIWAVGSDELGSGTPIQTLIEHWNGVTWSIVASPNMGSYNTSLAGVSALSPTDVWAVGGYSGVNRPYVAYPLSQHWDGQRWKIIHAPGANGSGFSGMAAINARQLWAVGDRPPSNSLTERWNGNRWGIVKGPSPGASLLQAVAARGQNTVWAVGEDQGSRFSQTLTQHWDGTRWQLVSSPNVSGQDNHLTGVTVVSAHGVWAVGYAMPHGGYSGTTLIEYYC